MLAPRTPDHPPLFQLGFHTLRLADVEKACVTDFPLSKSRKAIMVGLQLMIDRLINDGIKGHLWLNGSFTTKKIDPKDVDVVLKSPSTDYDSGSQEYRATIDWVISNLKATHNCDSYVLFERQPNDPLYEEWQWWYSYWHVKWGFNREEDPKGIVVIHLDRSAL